MLGETIQWVSVVKDIATHLSPNRLRLWVWMGSLFIRLLQEHLTVWPGLLYHQKGTVCAF